SLCADVSVSNAAAYPTCKAARNFVSGLGALSESSVGGRCAYHRVAIDDVSVDDANGVIFWHEDLPVDDADWNIHLRQIHLHIALLHERRAGLQVDERDGVRAGGTKARTQQRHARAVRA